MSFRAVVQKAQLMAAREKQEKDRQERVRHEKEIMQAAKIQNAFRRYRLLDATPQTFELLVMGISGDVFCTTEVESSWRVCQLKKIIALSHGILEHDQRYMVDGIELHDTDILSHVIAEGTPTITLIRGDRAQGPTEPEQLV